MLTLHSHANAHCIMKVLRGRLTETRFATPTDEDVQNQRPMTKTCETTYLENQVTYMADTLGTHRISNPDTTEYAVSLHCKIGLWIWMSNLSLTNRSIHTTKRRYVRMQCVQRGEFWHRP